MKKKIALIFETLLTIIIVGLCVIIFAISKGFHPSIAGRQILRVVTPSMEPTLKENSIIIIKKTSEANLKVNDIITFISDDPAVKGMYVTHRIHEIREEDGRKVYITKGDANPVEDRFNVTYNKIVGKYVKNMPLGNVIGKLIAKLTNSKVFFLVIILPILIVLIVYIWQLISIVFVEDEDDKDIEKERKRNENEGDI